MLYLTTFQSKIFLIMLYYGIISGFILELKLVLSGIFKSKIFNLLTDFLIGIIFGYLFIKSMNLYSFGEFRFYLLLAYFLGLFIEHKSVGFLIRNVIKCIYKFLSKIVYKLKNIKLFSKIFK